MMDLIPTGGDFWFGFVVGMIVGIMFTLVMLLWAIEKDKPDL